MSYCEIRIDLEAGGSDSSFVLKPSGDSVGPTGLPVGLMASVLRRPLSNHWQPSVSYGTGQSKDWLTVRLDVEILEGDHKPMGVSIGFIAAMHGPETDSSAEQRLEVDALVWREFLFGEAPKGLWLTARGPRIRSDSVRLLTRGKLRRA